MKSGMVLEVSKSKAVILKSDGTFEIIKANPAWDKGDVIELPRKSYNKIISIAASIAIFLLVGFGGTQYFTKEITISVDVNPSLELDINRFGRIVSIHTYNEDAKQIVDQLSLKYIPYNKALKEILSDDFFGAYIEKNPYMLVTVQTKEKEKEAIILEYVRSVIDTQIKTSYTGVQIDCISVDGEMLEQAHHYGVSAGIYSMLLELQRVGKDINLEDYLEDNLTQIRKEIEYCHKIEEKADDNPTEEADNNSEDSSDNESHHGHHH